MDLSVTPPLSLAHLTVLDVPPLELVSLAAATGYAAIGLRLHPAFPGSVCYELPAGTAASRQVRRRLQDEGVRVQDVEFVGLGAEFSAHALSGLLEAANALGARRLNVCGDDPDRSRLTASFAALCELAARFEMSVDLEYMAWRQVANFSDALGVVSSANQPNGGMLIDALHVWRSGGCPTDLRTAPSNRIRSAQLCDASATRPATLDELIQEARCGRLPPGWGALPLHTLLAELPDGTALSVEVPTNRTTSAEQHARENFHATMQMLRTVRTTTERH